MSDFSPDIGKILGLLAALAVVAGFIAIGGLVAGRRRFAAVDAFCGWGMVTAIFVLGGVFLPLSMTWLAAATTLLAAVGFAVLWRKRGDFPAAADATVLWRVLVLAVPLLFLVAAMKASQWDEFAQWLPNAWYLYRNDAFPGGAAMPSSPSVFPAYPYGLPMVTYLISVLRGAFVENGGALANLLLLLLYAPVYLHMLGQGLKAGDGWRKTWGAAALGILGVTVLSTTFVQKLVFTAYADSATAVVLAVAGVLAWKILQVLAAGAKGAEGENATVLAWQFSLASAIFLNLKQTNLVLLVLLLGGVSLVVLRDKKILIADFLRLLPVMLALPLAVYLAWRYHVYLYLQAGEFSLMPVADWRLPRAFEILARMLLIASRKGAYFIMMAVITVFALRALIRVRDGFDRMALITGVVFTGYVFFLWFMYIAAFGGTEAMRAGGFWRYNTQLGILGATTAAFGLAHLWRRWRWGRWGRWKVHRLLSALAVFLVLAIPVATSTSLRFDIRPQKDHMRMVGRDLAEILPVGARFAVVDQRGQGLAGKIVNFELSSGVNSRSGLKVYSNGRMFKSAAAMRKALESWKITYLWVHEPVPLVLEALGLDLAPAASYFLVKEKSGWKILRSWPYDGYTDPFSFPD